LTRDGSEEPEFGSSGSEGEAPADAVPRNGEPVAAARRRPISRLHVAAWVLSITGIGLFVVGLSSSESGSPAPVLWLVAALMLLGTGLAAGAGHQVASRRARPPASYRGPAPLLVFGLTAILATIGAVALGAVGVADPTTSFGALVSVAVTAGAYAVTVWFLVTRTGAMSWREMGWPPIAGRDTRWLAAGALTAVGMVIPTYFLSAFAGGLLSIALGVRLDSPLPAPGGGADFAAIAIAAIVFAPIGEELFFRGFALTAWWRDLGPQAALRRATLFFAAVHILNVSAATASEGVRLALVQFVVILPVAFVLGWLFIRRGIVAAIAGHMAFNGVAIALLALVTPAG
jgi:membrane protease YdiL (CAAX protease family)